MKKFQKLIYNIKRSQIFYIVLYLFLLLFQNLWAKENFLLQAGSLNENEAIVPYFYTAYQSNFIKGGIMKKGKQIYFETKADCNTENFSIHTGNLSQSIQDGFYISNGAYFSTFQTFPFRQPIGIHIRNKYNFLQIENAYYMNQTTFFQNELESNESDNEAEDNIQMHKIGLYFQKQKSKLYFGINKIIYNHNINIPLNLTSGSNINQEQLIQSIQEIFNDTMSYFIIMNYNVWSTNINFNFHYSQYYGYSSNIQLSNKIFNFKGQYFHNKIKNSFSSVVYQNNQKTSLLFLKLKYFQYQHIYSKDKKQFKINIPFQNIKPFYYYYSATKQIYGSQVEIPIYNFSILSTVYKELHTKIYFASLGIQAMNIFKISFLYFKNIQNKFQAYFPVNPNFYQKELYSFNINEDNFLYYNKSYLGCQSSLEYNQFFLTFLMLHFYQKETEKNLAFYRVGYKHEF